MRKAFIAVTIAVIAAILVSPVCAEQKISTVDLGRLFSKSPEFKTGKDKIDDRASKLSKQAKEKREAILALESKIKEKSLPENSPEVENFRNEVKNFERFNRDGQEELQKEFVKLRKQVGDKVMRAVEDYAKDNKIDLVLDKSELGRSPVLFGTPESDITDEVIKKLNG